MKAMIFAAGLGTRLKPLTDTMPKALVPIGGKPLIEHVIGKLSHTGFDDIVVNVHHFADTLEDWLKNNSPQGISVLCSDERQMLLETGGGIKKAKELLLRNNTEGRFLIHNVDILSNVDLKSFWNQGAEDDAVLLVSERQTQRYLVFDENEYLVGWTNVKTGEVKSPFPEVRESLVSQLSTLDSQISALSSRLTTFKLYAFAGIHQMKSSMFPLMDSFPEKFSIIDFYIYACATKKIRGYRQEGLRLMDVGKIDTLDQAKKFCDSL